VAFGYPPRKSSAPPPPIQEPISDAVGDA
jgi:hypothetical protein